MHTPRQILEHSSTIAVVGASSDPGSIAHWVPKQMQYHGWRVIPVNPEVNEIFGEHAYARLVDIPEHVDVVDVFDGRTEPKQVVREAILIGATAVWLEEGLTCPDGWTLAAEAGIDYVEDDCIATERTLAYLVCPGHQVGNPG